jgi:hypothetical protein
LLTLLCGKLVLEFLFGSFTGAESLANGRVATDAHLYGALGSAAAVGVMWLCAAGSRMAGKVI